MQTQLLAAADAAFLAHRRAKEVWGGVVTPASPGSVTRRRTRPHRSGS